MQVEATLVMDIRTTSDINQVLDFLKAFPPHETVTVMVCVKDSPLGLIFPLETPFKVLYSIYALRTCLEQQLQNVN